MVTALQAIAFDHAQVERHLPVRAPILQGKDLAGGGPDEDDRLAGKIDRQGASRPEVLGKRDGIPEIGMHADSTQIRIIARVLWHGGEL
jgi:hypothetical protein